MAMANMVATLGLDSSGFIVPIQQAASEAESSGERIITILHKQESSWASMIAATIPAMAELGANIISTGVEKTAQMAVATANSANSMIMLAAGTLQAGAAFVQLGLAIAQGSIGAIAAIGAATIATGAAVVTANGSWSTAGTAILNYGSTAFSVLSKFVPQLKAIAIGITAVSVSYKLSQSEIAASAIKSITNNGQVQASYGRLSASIGSLKDTFTRPFSDSASTAGTFAQYIIQEWTPLPLIGRKIGEGLSFGMDLASKAITATSTAITTASDSITGFALAAASGDFGLTGRFTAEAEALRNLARETDRVLALQNSQRSSFKMLADAQADAAAKSSRASEITEIGHIKTEAAINAETTRYQQLFAAQIQSLKVGEQLTAGQRAHMKAVIDTLAAQQEGISSGRITEDSAATASPTKADAEPINQIAKSYEAAQQSLAKLQMGQEAYARAAIMAMDATDDEVVALLALHDQTVALEAAQKQQQKTDQLFTQGANKITDMKDQIDLLTGSATNAEIEMRKLSRAGYDEAQIAEIGKLTEQMDSLKAKDKTGGTGGAAGAAAIQTKASFAGSSETASLFLRGVGGDSGGVQQKQLKAQELMLAELKISNQKSSAGSQTQTITANVV
jgi:hypothetical protein